MIKQFYAGFFLVQTPHNHKHDRYVYQCSHAKTFDKQGFEFSGYSALAFFFQLNGEDANFSFMILVQELA